MEGWCGENSRHTQGMGDDAASPGCSHAATRGHRHTGSPVVAPGRRLRRDPGLWGLAGGLGGWGHRGGSPGEPRGVAGPVRMPGSSSIVHCSQSRGSLPNHSRQHGGRSWCSIPRGWGRAEGHSKPRCCRAPPLARAPGDIGDRGGPGGAPGQGGRFGGAGAAPTGFRLCSGQMSRWQRQRCRRAPGRISPSP